MSIVLERLTKRFGPQVVLDRVSLEVRDGELFVLLGASGSGKSTVLRLVAGLAQPDEGRILLHGRNVTHLPPQQRGTGFVFQNYSIFRHMSVAENVEFGLKIRKVPAAERARRRDDLLDMVGLMGLGSRYAGQLSGGQLQRVALARALAYEPAVLLLDEPFGALDVKIRAQLRRSLKAIQRRLGVTTILVTHDQDEAFELADRIGLVERGRLLEVGDPETLYARPRSLAVATFLGGGTVLAVRAQGGHVRFGDVEVPIPPDVPHEQGGWVAMLVRPEQVTLDGAQQASPHLGLDAGAGWGGNPHPSPLPEGEGTAQYEVAGGGVVGDAFRSGDGLGGAAGLRSGALTSGLVEPSGAAPRVATGPDGIGLPRLGRGVVAEQTFGGATRRVRLRLPRLAGARQLSPVPPFGEEGTLVDAVLPADEPLPDGEVRVGLRGWHLLEAPPARLLVYDAPEGDETPLLLARALAERLGAGAAVLGVADAADDVEPLRVALEQRYRAQMPADVEVKVRQGDVAEQLAMEQRAGFYEVLVLPTTGRSRARSGFPFPPGALALAAVKRPAIPVLLARQGPATPAGAGKRNGDPARGLDRVLICTAAGEPGKSDVRVGGWLARRLGATATLLYVLREGAEPPPLVRAHFERAAATLRGLDVATDVRYRPSASPADGIIEEVREGSYGLLVVGAHGPQARSALARDDVTLQVIARSDAPVLVVPAEE